VSPLAGPLVSPLGGEDTETIQAYKRMLRDLFPTGRLWNWAIDSVLDRFLVGAAVELTRLHHRVLNFLAELDPTITAELLAEYEADLEIIPAAGATDAARRAAVVARRVHRQRFRPADFQLALYLVLGLTQASDVVIVERNAGQAAAMQDEREIYRFFVYRNPALSGTPDLAEAQRIVDDIKPAHTLGYVIQSTNFLCEDPYSLCDRDILGV
jgi:uncharacterized protein YmfQ (DUF2313 family)